LRLLTELQAVDHRVWPVLLPGRAAKAVLL